MSLRFLFFLRIVNLSYFTVVVVVPFLNVICKIDNILKV